jgi:hypothetical protein
MKTTGEWIYYPKKSRPAKESKIALIGWSLQAIEAIDKLNKPFIVVGPPDFQSFANKYKIPFIGWDFGNDREQNEDSKQTINAFGLKTLNIKTETIKDKSKVEEVNEKAEELYNILKSQNANLAIALFEDTVEWAGALNARFMQDPTIFDKSLIFRNKAKMKRKAQMAGLQVGVFEEVFNKEDIRRFLKRIKEISFKDNEKMSPIHIKPFDKAGTVGHRVIYSEKDIAENLNGITFPCLAESHLNGKEISVETFIHDGEIKFMNISDYVVFEHSIMVPPSANVEEKRPLIRKAMERLINTFDIRYGITHAEFFLSPNGDIKFGEVATRIPGGHIFDLIQRAYGFNPFQGNILCCDPSTKKEEFENFFPDETKPKGHACCIMAYPNVKYINDLDIPEDLEEHPYFEKHNFYIPANREVEKAEGNGNHYGTVFFYGNDSKKMMQPIMKYVNHSFYI